MRRNKEIIVLLTLLVGAMAFVLWYVVDRRARERARSAAPAPPVATQPAAPAPAPAVAIQDRKTIDFSGGKPVVKDDAENQAAIDDAVKDMQAALKDVSFDPPKQPAETPPPQPAPPAPETPPPEKK